jgi:hypothetical protein
MIVILILVLVLILFYIDREKEENFMIYWSGPPIDNMPFNNTRVGQTTNMSYDLRGDPLKIPKYSFMWNNSTITPIYNKQLC